MNNSEELVFLGALLIFAGGAFAAQAPSGGRAAVDSFAQSAVDSAARSAVDSAAPTRLRGAFGYEIGEERRYVLEPARSLRPGESAWWSIVLDDIEGEGDDTRIIFDLEHERTEVIRDLFGGINGRMQAVTVDGRLTVNRFGFPERLVITEQHDVHGETGSQSDVRTTLFTFDGERFIKQVRINGREWKFNIEIASHDDLDLGGPVGLYAYVPKALSCLGAPGAVGRPSRCYGGDPAFANPGLLSIALPVMWEEQVNKKRFLFFMPSGVGTVPGGLMDMNRFMALERDQLRNNTRYYEKTDLEVKEYVQSVEIGPRFVDAWLLDASGEMREFYAEPDGRVLKVFIDPHPVTYGQRWIRLLFPSEY
ncbi:MAG: hypothetical protein O7A04_08555 [Acidobacteria bacterium]|nr:hypothetical protein [Acidobacteriota bacterium]